MATVIEHLIDGMGLFFRKKDPLKYLENLLRQQIVSIVFGTSFYINVCFRVWDS